MPSVVYEYVRNIAVFIIFMGLAEVIVPDGKHKSYINMTLGIILTFLMVSPIIKLFGQDLDGVFANFGLNIEKRVLAAEYAYYDNEQNNAILNAYKNNLKEQLKRLVTPYNKYDFVDGGFIVGEKEDDFGEIYEIWITLSEKSNKNSEKKGLIRVEPITVGGGLAEPQVANSEDDMIKEIKKSISDFYKIEYNNIYVQLNH